MKIDVQALSTYRIGEGGDTISLDLVGADDQKVTLEMDVDQIGMLVMTLPSLIETALKRRFRDASLRYSYPAGRCTVEQASDPDALIVTMQTADGFGVSFTVSQERAKELSEALSLGASSDLSILAN
jgi:hypothetical protein